MTISTQCLHARIKTNGLKLIMLPKCHFWFRRVASIARRETSQNSNSCYGGRQAHDLSMESLIKKNGGRRTMGKGALMLFFPPNACCPCPKYIQSGFHWLLNSKVLLHFPQGSFYSAPFAMELWSSKVLVDLSKVTTRVLLSQVGGEEKWSNGWKLIKKQPRTKEKFPNSKNN